MNIFTYCLLVITGAGLICAPNVIEVRNDKPIEVIKTLAVPDWKAGVLSLLEEAGIDIEVAKKVIACESSWKKDAVGDGGDSLGLWQINKVHLINKECLLDPVCSTKVAIKLIKDNWRGFENWTCFRNLYK